jgi:hypothetical protein
MIVWGGGAYTASNTGGRYNPLDDAWEPTSTGTQSRTGHTAIWTGDEMVVWGGYSGGFNGSHLNTGARYNPSTDSWMPTSVLSAPEERGAHAAVWTGAEMIIWGGYDGQASRFLNSGGRYNPQSDVWTLTNVANAPSPVEFPAAVWTGSQMIVWGGYDGNFVLNTGSRYCADAAATPAPVPTATPIVSVSVSPPQVMEGGVATFQIGASPNTIRPVTVAFTMSGKAKNGTDYILSNSGQVTIPFGFDSIPVFLITIADHAKEMKETATMTLQPGSGYSFGGAGGKKKKVKPPKATVTLIDTP